MSGHSLKEYFGRVTNVVFRSPEDDFTIAWFVDVDRRRRRIRGALSWEDIQAKSLTIRGVESQDRRGPIFLVQERWRGSMAPWSDDPPTEGLVAFLTSDAIKGLGVGPSLAPLLGGAVGDRLWAALTCEPETLARGLVLMKEAQRLRNRDRRASREQEVEEVEEGEETDSEAEAEGAAPPVLPRRFWDIVEEGRQYAQRVQLAADELGRRVEAEMERALALQGAVAAYGHNRVNALARLMRLGLSLAYSLRTLDRFGIQAVDKILEDPYVLMDVDGISFSKADTIARTKVHPPLGPTDLRRYRALARHILEQAAGEGSTSLPRDVMVRQIETVGKAAEFGIVPEEVLHAAIESEAVLERDGDLYLPNHWRNERIIAKGLSILALRPDRVIPQEAWAAGDMDQLTEEQARAVRMAIEKHICAIFGLPGAGKTRITQVIRQVAECMGVPVTFCATTGKAATQIDRANGDASSAEACTLHSLLGTDLRPRPLPAGIVLVDECSMMDNWLLARAVESVVLSEGATSLVLIGDPHQLPSVGAGAVARDIRDSGVIPFVELTRIFRQDRDTLTAINATRIRLGKFPFFNGDAITERRLAEINGYFQGPPLTVDQIRRNAEYRYAATPAEGAQRVVEEFRKLKKEASRRKKSGKEPLDIIEDVQVYTPQHHGQMGTKNLNLLLQAELNPKGEPVLMPARKKKNGEEIREARKDKQGLPIRVGDPVIQTKNDKSGRRVANGMRGRVVRALESGGVVVRFQTREVEYEPSQVRELVLAYAATVHKGQGDQQKITILALHHSEHFFMMDKAMAYVGSTRPTERLIFVGTRRAMRIAIRRVRGDERHTRLADKLRERYFGLQVSRRLDLPEDGNADMITEDDAMAARAVA